jgi:hypothetical protein
MSDDQAPLPAGRNALVDWRAVLAAGTVLLASLWFLIGLAAPLTPSVGRPDATTLVIFAVAPALAIAGAAQVARSRAARWSLRALSAFIALVAILWVL